LKRLLALIAELDVNIREMNYFRTMQSLPVQQNEITLTLEMRDHAHMEQLLALLHEKGYEVTKVQIS
jgi:type II secretory pathway component PulL